MEGEQKSATTDDVADLRGMLVLEGASRWIELPISVGKKWSTRYQSNIGGTPVWVNSETAVTGVEEVATPAGTFRAFKIERTDIGAKGINWRRVYFYSPQIESLVKYHFETALGRVHDIELIKLGSTR